MPADLKKQLAVVASDGFVIKRAVFQPCLELYPLKQWNILMDKVGQLNQFNRKNNDFISLGQLFFVYCGVVNHKKQIGKMNF